MPVPSFPAGRPHGHAQSRRAGQLPAELLRRRAAENPRSAASRRLPTSRKRPKVPPARRKLRRPLQPGPAVLHQPDHGRAAPHRDGADIRAQQGGDAGHPRADGRRISSTSTRRSPSTVGTEARDQDDAEAGRCGGADATGPRCRRRRSASSRTDRQRFEGRKLGVLVTAGADAALLKKLQVGDREGRRRFRGHRAEGGRRRSERRKLDRGQAHDRWRALGALRCCGAAAGGGGDGRSAAGSRRRAISSPTPSPTASSSAMSKRPCRCSKKLASPRRTSTKVLLRCRRSKDVAGFVGKLGQLAGLGPRAQRQDEIAPEAATETLKAHRHVPVRFSKAVQMFKRGEAGW